MLILRLWKVGRLLARFPFLRLWKVSQLLAEFPSPEARWRVWLGCGGQPWCVGGMWTWPHRGRIGRVLSAVGPLLVDHRDHVAWPNGREQAVSKREGPGYLGSSSLWCTFDWLGSLSW